MPGACTARRYSTSMVSKLYTPLLSQFPPTGLSAKHRYKESKNSFNKEFNVSIFDCLTHLDQANENFLIKWQKNCYFHNFLSPMENVTVKGHSFLFSILRQKTDQEKVYFRKNQSKRYILIYSKDHP